MWNKIISKLESAIRGTRLDGWSMLRAESAQRLVTEERYCRLSQILIDEGDEGVWHMGVSVMLALGPRVYAASALSPISAPLSGDSDSLADWLWQPFREPSVVFGLSDPHYMRRDDGALIMLARHLSHAVFPEVRFHPALMPNPRWSPVLSPRFPAGVCFIGRLGLYGPEALRQWGNPLLRCGFCTHDISKRPHRPGRLDPYFHCIYERTNSRTPNYYRTFDRDGRRTDYGLVQRYTTQYEGQLVAVVLCAGATSVGTLAAAQWAARNLPRPLHSSDTIRSPEGLEPTTTMEALLEVTADLDTHEWALTGVKLHKLFIGDSEWDQDKQIWRKQVMYEVTIQCETSGPLRPSGVLIQRELKKMKPGSQISQLLAAVHQQTGGVPGAILNLGKLKQQLQPFYKKKLDENGLKRQLSLLKLRYLRESLTIGDQVSLQARLTVKRPAGRRQPLSTGGRIARGRSQAMHGKSASQAWPA